MAEPATAADPPPAPRATELVSLKPLVETVGLIAAQLSVLGSVLIYFGTVAMRVESRFFGLDPSGLDYSNQELLVRSIAPMLGPLAVGGAVGVLVLQLNSFLGTRADRLAGWSIAGPAITGGTMLGVALIVVGAVWQWRLDSRHSYWSPLFLGGGAVVLLLVRGTAALIASPGRSGSAERDGRPTSPIRALDAHSKLVLGAVLVFAAFGFTARLAEADGFRRAVRLVTDLDTKATVSVLSEEPLVINREGVACFEVTGSRFTRRYTGLHLIAQRNGTSYLVPVGFDTDSAVTIALPDTPSIRLEHDATPQFRSLSGRPPLAPLRSPDAELAC